MALIFPASPSLNQIYQQDGVSYEWTGSKWRRTNVFQNAIVTEYSDIVEYTANTASIEPEKYNYFKITVDANTTITIPSASKYTSFVMELNLSNASNVITWDDNIQWAGGVPPSIEYGNGGAGGAINLLQFNTYDGTNWIATTLSTAAINYGPQISSLSASASNRNEGQTQTITLVTQYAEDGMVIPYTVTGIIAADLSAGSLTGNFVISNNTASASFTFANDNLTEGSETATLTLGGYGNTIQWTIIDTSDATGQQAYTSPGTFTWVAPANITSVDVVAIGGGGGSFNTGTTATIYSGGGGGELRWKNDITVVPGTSYTVVVGAGGLGSVAASAGGQSYFINTSTVRANGGAAGTTSTTGGGAGGTGGVGTSGGNGGKGGNRATGGGGGGGAGGYGGAGGAGGAGSGIAGSAGSGGAGGGGGGGSTSGAIAAGGAGGGVGILGQGSNGAGGAVTSGQPYRGDGGSGGSGGGQQQANGGNYGGGGAWTYFTSAGTGGTGAVRIIWGPNRAFPSTNTGNL